ncbi:carbohydrate ABC transporter permease [Paenibacillus eucommiae]|uniref:Aldouronate transport system permease protein n=1 Tax=Paenibacillus eucommiae TaxID=1355755 RepID=A0ABS4IU14_9BACL|nr:carbohydrate ABC transporter permease [Paenibacillus eucommiae]MBP1991073.1 putative aldouronate transport system permease protein [Paenibacillus eucommiae]
MVVKTDFSRKLFIIANYAFLLAISLLCLLPLIHILAISLSSSSVADAGLVKLWPVKFNVSAYEYVLQNKQFLHSLFISVKRVLLGTSLNMLLTIMAAYPLSKEVSAFKMRTVYVWLFFLTILFGGGLIPTYMVVQSTGLIDSIWALVIPGAVPVFSVILMLNFYRNLPKELEESAFIDGASHYTILWKIFVPLSVPAIATLTLFSIVSHWNAWFDGIIYMNSFDKYPLQSYLQKAVIQKDPSSLSSIDQKLLKEISSKTMSAAQLFLGALPILLVYPFLQRFFISGIALGSVKG